MVLICFLMSVELDVDVEMLQCYIFWDVRRSYHFYHKLNHLSYSDTIDFCDRQLLLIIKSDTVFDALLYSCI